MIQVLLEALVVIWLIGTILFSSFVLGGVVMAVVECAFPRKESE